MLTPEKKIEYSKLSRKVDEAYTKAANKQIPGLWNNYKNRLEAMKKFCIENGLLSSKYLK